MFAHLGIVAAATVQIMAQNEQFLAGLDQTLSSQAKIITDKEVPTDSYIFKLDDMSMTGNDIKLLNEMLSVTSSLREVPSELSDILSELSYKKEDLVADLKSGAYNFAVIFTNDPESIKNLRGIDKVSHIKFFLSTQKELASSYGVPFPGILAFNAQDKNIIRMPMHRSADSLVASISIPAFSQINQENFKYLQSLDQKLLYVIDKNRSFEENKKEFSENAKLCSGFAKFIFFTPEDVPSLLPLLNVSEGDYPLLLSLAKEGKGIVRSVKGDTFLTSVQNLVTQTAEKLLFSSQIPADNESRLIKVMNTETLKKAFENNKTDVLVAFTSPSCRFCLALEPELQKFATLMSGQKIPIFIGNYNVMENEEPSNLEISGVPTLYFLKKGATTPVRIPSEIRTATDLITFVSKEGETSKVNPESFTEQLKSTEEKEVSEAEMPEEEVSEVEDHAGRDVL